MNELELLERLREEIPLTEISPTVESAVLAAIRDPARSATHSRSRQWADHNAAHLARALRLRGRRRGLRLALAGTLALAAAAAGSGIAASMTPAQPPVTSSGPPIPWSGRPTAIWSGTGYPSFGEARTGAQLIEYATRAAAVAPGRAPRADEWIFTKVEFADSSGGGGGYLFGPPDRRLIGLSWTRVDKLEYAEGGDFPASLPPSQVVHGKLRLSPGSPGTTMAYWKSVDYSYLKSLPADPARLESVILAENASSPSSPAMPDNVTVFSAIYTLLVGQAEGIVWVPPKLAATMYQLLLRLPGVHFEAGTDLAGRFGIGIYMVLDGWFKQELVINPVTYTYMGDKDVAVQAHDFSGTDGVRHVEKGHVLGWQALLEDAIVQRPGQFP